MLICAAIGQFLNLGVPLKLGANLSFTTVASELAPQVDCDLQVYKSEHKHYSIDQGQSGVLASLISVFICEFELFIYSIQSKTSGQWLVHCRMNAALPSGRTGTTHC